MMIDKMHIGSWLGNIQDVIVADLHALNRAETVVCVGIERVSDTDIQYYCRIKGPTCEYTVFGASAMDLQKNALQAITPLPQ